MNDRLKSKRVFLGPTSGTVCAYNKLHVNFLLGAFGLLDRSYDIILVLFQNDDFRSEFDLYISLFEMVLEYTTGGFLSYDVWLFLVQHQQSGHLESIINKKLGSQTESRVWG